MTTNVIHVDFRARRVLRPSVADVIKSITCTAPSTPAPDLTDFLGTKSHPWGCDGDKAEDMTAAEIARIVRAYIRDTYPTFKFRTKTHKYVCEGMATKIGSIDVYLDSVGVVCVYLDTGKYSDTMTEILDDIEAFANRFNCRYNHRDYRDRFQVKVHVCV